jgi:hypothetical protein
MLFFWTNTKAARERRLVDEEEFSSRIKSWASGVSVGQDSCLLYAHVFQPKSLPITFEL